MRVLVITIFFASLLASCRSTRNIQTAIAKKDTIAVVANDSGKADSVRYINEVVSQMQAKQIGYTSFNGKIDVDYRGGDGKRYDLNANVRMYKDSMIWISASAVLGIEVMRVLITKDSIKLLNKHEKTYTERSIDYLQEVTQLPLDLKTLQNLLIGNLVYFDSNVVSYSKDANTVSVLSLGTWFKNLVTLSESDKSIQRIKLDDADASRNRTAVLSYSDYETKKGPAFATKRNITIAEKSRLDIKLDFKNYDFNGEVTFPFSVPKNYERL
jgi:hypothetical protein